MPRLAVTPASLQSILYDNAPYHIALCANFFLTLFFQSIGILASLLVKIESTPYAPELSRSSPIYSLLRCLAAHVPSVPSSFRDTILSSACSSSASKREQKKCDKALHEVERTLFDAGSEWNSGNEAVARAYRSILSTTQAVDMIVGGVKANALPELASAVVNHRIRTDRYFFPIYTSVLRLIS